jgi:hypothetical protein
MVAVCKSGLCTWSRWPQSIATQTASARARGIKIGRRCRAILEERLLETFLEGRKCQEAPS